MGKLIRQLLTRTMKLWIGLVAFAGLVVAQEGVDYSDLEKGKGNKNQNSCNCDNTPSSCENHCASCDAAACGKKYKKSCKKSDSKRARVAAERKRTKETRR